MTEISANTRLDKCVKFLNDIGIKTIFEQIQDNTFLPGLSIMNGTIIIAREKLKNPGDVLHEAGHIAVVPSAERHSLNAVSIEKREQREAEEMMAIAWSYAACVHLNIDPVFVFHNDGYKGGGGSIVENFQNKRYFGLPMLQWIGLAVDEKNAKESDVQPYPRMIKWLRD